MKKVITTILLAFFSILAHAHATTANPSDKEEVKKQTQEIMVAPVGFDKVLSLLLFEIDDPQVDIEISQNSVGMVFKTSLKVSEVDVLEVDLNDFEGGTYTLRVGAGEYAKVHTLILP